MIGSDEHAFLLFAPSRHNARYCKKKKKRMLAGRWRIVSACGVEQSAHFSTEGAHSHSRAPSDRLRIRLGKLLKPRKKSKSQEYSKSVIKSRLKHYREKGVMPACL